MLNKEYTKAYTEVIEILKYVPQEDFYKIPNEKIEFYKKHMDKEYKYAIDETLQFEQQIMSDITKAILANIFRDYWATENQKTTILAKEKYDLENLEKAKQEKYPPNEIFKNKKETEIVKNISTSLIEYKKKNWYIKFINYMKNIFKINK